MTTTHKPYRAICKERQLIYGTGTVVVVTGWTPPEYIARKLDPETYAAVGGLTSCGAGIDYLIRNLLANPQVTGLLLLGNTPQDANSGSVDCLEKFFRYGVEEEPDDGQWYIRRCAGLIGADIPKKALDRLWENLTWWRCADTDEVVEKLPSFTLSPCWGDEPMIFPPPEPKATVFPGHRYGHRVEGATIAETWVKIIHRIKTTGTVRPAGYDGNWQELIDLVAVVTDEPSDFYFPEPNYLPCDRPYIESYLPQMLEDAPYTPGVKYTYGQRLRSWFGRDQIQDCVLKLCHEIDSASAVMSLWDAGGLGAAMHPGANRADGDSDHQHSGSPCLNHVWLRVVNGELSLTATFRSNDMFSAWPANAFGLRELQRYICDHVSVLSDRDLQMGPLVTISQSAHIYDSCWENADRLIATQYPALCRPSYDDPAGNYVIELDGRDIVVSRCNQAGVTVATYRGRRTLELIRQIAQDAPAIRPDHIGYLGQELYKAHLSARYQEYYVQDK